MDLYRSTKTLYLSGAYSDCWLASVDGGESDSLSEPVSTLTETAPAPQTKLVQQNPVSWASLRFVFPPSQLCCHNNTAAAAEEAKPGGEIRRKTGNQNRQLSMRNFKKRSSFKMRLYGGDGSSVF